MSRASHVAFFALVAVVLSGCGFHLRNALTLPEDLGPVRVVSADPYSPLGQSLAQALGRIGATPAPDPATSVPGDGENVAAAPADVATLEVISERWGSRPISIDQFGRAQEYTLRYAVVFALRSANGADVVPRNTIELSRDYVSSPVNPTGAEGEQELLAREMRREMVASILRKIDAADKAGGALPPEPDAQSAAPAPEDAAALESAAERIPAAPAPEPVQDPEP